MARTELDELGLKDWKLEFDARPKRRLGQTRYATRTIGLSTQYVRLNTWEQVRTTVRHEAAHALVGPGYAHGPVWKRKARELGVNATHCNRSSDLVMPATNIRVICPVHGDINTGRTRMPKAGARYKHNGCGQPVTFERKG